MIVRRVGYILLLIGFTAFFIFYPGWISRLFVVLALALPVLSLLISLPFARSLSVEMRVPEKTRRGTETQLTVSVLSRGAACGLPCSLRIVLRDLMNAEPTKYAVSSSSVAVAFTGGHSGVWQLDVTKAAAYDCLGLFAFRPKSLGSVRILVLPNRAEPSPRPDFSSLSASVMKPKPGGGFSEIHEMREYRPGDPMRSVHWKLTAKTDELIVREPQVIENLRAVVRLRLSKDRSANDHALDRLAWVSAELLSRDVPHRIFYENTGFSASVSCDADFEDFLSAVLSEPPGTEYAAQPAAEWSYAISAAHDKEEEAGK